MVVERSKKKSNNLNLGNDLISKVQKSAKMVHNDFAASDKNNNMKCMS